MTVEFLWSFPTCSVVICLTTLQMKWSLRPLVVWAFKLLSYSYTSFSFEKKVSSPQRKIKGQNCISEHGKMRIHL